MYWKNGLVFSLHDKTVYATCGYNQRKITIQVQDKDDTEISVGGDFEALSQIKNSKFRKVYENDFWFVFPKSPKLVHQNPKNMHPNIQQALKNLENANIAGYFEEMDRVEMPTIQIKSTYARFKGVFMAGQAPWNFSQQLETFAKEVANNFLSGSGDTIGRDKIDRQINMGQGSNYIENQTLQGGNQTSQPQNRQKILFLAANPTNEARLQTDAEYRIIQQRLQAAQERDSFELLNPALSVQIEDLIKAMNQKPEIVHFSGHGSMDGILISNAQNEAQVMPTAAIKRLFKQHKDSTKLVVLNACYSAEQAKVISEFGIHVIGMHLEIADEAAIGFAGGLYIGLGAGKNIETAFDDAMIVISTTHPDSELIPEIWKNGEKLDL
ncbi:MAG: CHAT domain-containing protein [Microscillaceae bacterium]|nr:CHAT domain-containing protein [Microscillaceae bacterium]